MKRGENRHQLFILCALEGMNTVQIAETFGVDRLTVANVLNDPVYREKIERGRNAQIDAVAQKGAKELIADIAAEAAQTLIDLMKFGESERIRFSSANSLLEKAGYVPPTGQNSLVEKEPPRLVIQDLTVNQYNTVTAPNASPTNGKVPIAPSNGAVSHTPSTPSGVETPLDKDDVVDFSKSEINPGIRGKE